MSQKEKKKGGEVMMKEETGKGGRETTRQEGGFAERTRRQKHKELTGKTSLSQALKERLINIFVMNLNY